MAVTGTVADLSAKELSGHEGGKFGLGIAYGSATLGSGSAVVSTGLLSVLAMSADLAGVTTAPATTMFVPGADASGVVTVYAWKPSAAGTTTLVADASSSVIRYFAIGTI